MNKMHHLLLTPLILQPYVYILHTRSDSLPPCTLRTGMLQVLVDTPSTYLLSTLPLAVTAILRRHHTCLAVAGGAVLGGVAQYVRHGSDVDMFLYGLDQEASQKVLGQIEAEMAENFQDEYAITRSPAAVTFTKNKQDEDEGKGASLLDRPFQVVLGMHRARSQILEYFDLTPCKVRG